MNPVCNEGQNAYVEVELTVLDYALYIDLSGIGQFDQEITIIITRCLVNPCKCAHLDSLKVVILILENVG